MADTTDPLAVLPAEIVLRILDFTAPAALAALTRVNWSWHYFIDQDHREAIYATKTEHPPAARDFAFLENSQSFAKYYGDVASWKDLCKRQTLLGRQWQRSAPVVSESIFQVGIDAIWRFKPDFQRRLVLSTSQAGGLCVTDMDNGERLFSLPREVVRPFAHLEYQDGTAVFDREGNAVEVWRVDDTLEARGTLKMVAVLPHEKITRGFQLSFDTLCVVSLQGQGFVYENMLHGEPQLKTRMAIDEGATGHLHQCADAVAWSQGPHGYHFYDKSSGQCLGVLHPNQCSTENFFHIAHAEAQGMSDQELLATAATEASAIRGFPPRKDRTLSVHVQAGPRTTGEPLSIDDDEWGAGMFDGDLFVGISRGGRVFVCSNWRKALQDRASFDASTSVVECDSDGSTFDLGGWLSVNNHRVMFEIEERIYVLGLDDDDRVVPAPQQSRPSFHFASSLSPQLAVPVSFMALYEDCIMTTFTTLALRDRTIFPLAETIRGFLPTKLIRVLSLAPRLDGDKTMNVGEAPPPAESNPESYESMPGPDLSLFVQMLADEAEDDEGYVDAATDLMGETAEWQDLEELD